MYLMYFHLDRVYQILNRILYWIIGRDAHNSQNERCNKRTNFRIWVNSCIIKIITHSSLEFYNTIVILQKKIIYRSEWRLISWIFLLIKPRTLFIETLKMNGIESYLMSLLIYLYCQIFVLDVNLWCRDFTLN